jgi:antitoxin component of MazEF toxin-antitoxin module
MKVKVQKIGNSHMVTLPAQVVEKAGLYPGQTVEVSMVKDEISVKPVHKKINITQMKWGTVSIPGYTHEKAMQYKKQALYDR